MAKELLDSPTERPGVTYFQSRCANGCDCCIRSSSSSSTTDDPRSNPRPGHHLVKDVYEHRRERCDAMTRLLLVSMVLLLLGAPLRAMEAAGPATESADSKDKKDTSLRHPHRLGVVSRRALPAISRVGELLGRAVAVQSAETSGNRYRSPSGHVGCRLHPVQDRSGPTGSGSQSKLGPP